MQKRYVSAIQHYSKRIYFYLFYLFHGFLLFYNFFLTIHFQTIFLCFFERCLSQNCFPYFLYLHEHFLSKDYSRKMIVIGLVFVFCSL